MVVYGVIYMTKQQIRIRGLSNNDLLQETLRIVELNSYALVHKGYLPKKSQSLEDDLKAELSARFLLGYVRE